MSVTPEHPRDTRDEAYAARLVRKQGAWWKRVLSVQTPYRWNLRRQHLGRTLDVGCGIGRNLVALADGSVGVDHNQESVSIVRRRGMQAFTVEEWRNMPRDQVGLFDGVLVAHVVEHMSRDDARGLLDDYLPYLRPGGKLFLVCPQEKGFASDSTHVTFTTGDDLVELARGAGLEPRASYSFPFPRRAGQWFPYNEFCLLATKPI